MTVGPSPRSVAGEVVGERALLKLQRRWASVVAVGHVRAVALSADDLAEMSEQMPELADRLREMMARRERENETY